MVGFACSSDEYFDYNYILIKVYSCNDHMFIRDSDPCEIYRVNRKLRSSEILYTNKKDGTRYISLAQVLDIVDRLKIEEYKRDYPVLMSWLVNSSGICEVKSVSDSNLSWPVTAYCIERGIDYVNITDFFFDKKPCRLYMSFIEDVINDAMYNCGLYEGDYVKTIGDALFCSFEFAYFLHYYFGINEFWNTACKLNEKEFILPTPKNINSNIDSFEFITEYTNTFNSQNLCMEKTKALADTLDLIKNCLNRPELAHIFAEELKSVFEKAFGKIGMQKDDFVFYSGGMDIADMKYLTFNELIGVYVFGERKKEFANIIKTNRQRSRTLKTIKEPCAVYNNKLILDL